MKLLICTQKVDEQDPTNVMSFFTGWLKEFAKQCDEVHVIALGVGGYSLQANVHIYSLGKESGQSRWKYVWRFYRYIFSLRHEYDAVFVHMNPEYVVLGGIFWRIMGKRIGMWYTHRNVDTKLRIAEKLAQVIFSSAPVSFRIPSKKVHFMGHGLDVGMLKAVDGVLDTGVVTILHVGRITKIKNIDVFVRAGALIKERIDKPFRMIFAGCPTTEEDKIYDLGLQKSIDDLGLRENVKFLGNVSYDIIPRLLKEATFSVNLCPTGGMDKAVLESVICGTPVFVSNEAFRPHFDEMADMFMVKYRDPEDLAAKIQNFVKTSTGQEIQELQKRWTEKFSLNTLIEKILLLL